MRFLEWYMRDSWISGYVCGTTAMLLGNIITRAIWPKR